MRIAFVIPYFGSWPVWFPAFLISCRANPTIHWIFFTDCKVPEAPENVLFINSTLKEIGEKACSVTGSTVTLNHSYKLCDLKPAYGDIFREYLVSYEFWGFCDIDVVWGDIRKFIENEDLHNYDIITAMENRIAGHFTLIRNNDFCRTLYRYRGYYKEAFIQGAYKWFDEQTFSEMLHDNEISTKVRIRWDKEFLQRGIESPAHQDYVLDKWYFTEGRLFEMKKEGKRECMYLHFLSWKRTIKSCLIENGTNSFYISFNGIHAFESSLASKKLNKIRRLFWGYSRRQYFLRLRQRLMKKIKNLSKI